MSDLWIWVNPFILFYYLSAIVTDKLRSETIKPIKSPFFCPGSRLNFYEILSFVIKILFIRGRGKKTGNRTAILTPFLKVSGDGIVLILHKAGRSFLWAKEPSRTAVFVRTLPYAVFSLAQKPSFAIKKPYLSASVIINFREKPSALGVRRCMSEINRRGQKRAWIRIIKPSARFFDISVSAVRIVRRKARRILRERSKFDVFFYIPSIRVLNLIQFRFFEFRACGVSSRNIACGKSFVFVVVIGKCPLFACVFVGHGFWKKQFSWRIRFLDFKGTGYFYLHAVTFVLVFGFSSECVRVCLYAVLRIVSPFFRDRRYWRIRGENWLLSHIPKIIIGKLCLVSERIPWTVNFSVIIIIEMNYQGRSLVYVRQLIIEIIKILLGDSVPVRKRCHSAFTIRPLFASSVRVSLLNQTAIFVIQEGCFPKIVCFWKKPVVLVIFIIREKSVGMFLSQGSSTLIVPEQSRDSILVCVDCAWIIELVVKILGRSFLVHGFHSTPFSAYLREFKQNETSVAFYLFWDKTVIIVLKRADIPVIILYRDKISIRITIGDTSSRDFVLHWGKPTFAPVEWERLFSINF